MHFRLQGVNGHNRDSPPALLHCALPLETPSQRGILHTALPQRLLNLYSCLLGTKASMSSSLASGCTERTRKSALVTLPPKLRHKPPALYCRGVSTQCCMQTDFRLLFLFVVGAEFSPQPKAPRGELPTARTQSDGRGLWSLKP